MDALQIHISRQISEKKKSQTVKITDQRGEKIWEGAIKPGQLLAAIKGWKSTKRNPNHLQIPGTKVLIPMSKDRRSIEIVANGKSAELGRISLFPVGKKGGANVKQVEHQINTLFAESRKATASPRPAASTPEVTPRAEAPTPPPVEEARQATQSSEYTIVHPQPKADPTATDTTFTPSVPQEVQVEVKAEPKRSGLFKKLAASLAAIASVTGAGYLGFPHLGKVSSWLPMKLV